MTQQLILLITVGIFSIFIGVLLGLSLNGVFEKFFMKRKNYKQISLVGILLILVGMLIGIMLMATNSWPIELYETGNYEKASWVDLIIVIVSVVGSIIVAIYIRLFVTKDLETKHELENFLRTKNKLMSNVDEIERRVNLLSPVGYDKSIVLIRDQLFKMQKNSQTLERSIIEDIDCILSDYPSSDKDLKPDLIRNCELLRELANEKYKKAVN